MDNYCLSATRYFGIIHFPRSRDFQIALWLISNWWLGIFVLLILTGCTPTAVPTTVTATETLPSERASPTATPLFTSDPIVLPTETPEVAAPIPTVTPSPLPASTATAPSPTATTAAACTPQGNTAAELAPFTNVDQLRSSVLAYLYAGGSLLTLVEQLDTVEYVMSFGAEADVDGDEISEIILTVDFITWEPYKTHTVAWVVTCEAGNYEIVFEDDKDRALMRLVSPIVLVNFDEDIATEIILEWSLEGTDGGWTAEMIQWVDGSPKTYWFEWPMPDELFSGRVDLEFDDLNGDGIQEIITTGHTPVHMTGGPTRDMVRIIGDKLRL